jgi:glucose-6-phosphate 1-epimerase
MNSAELNARFGIADHLRFVDGEGGFIYAEIDNGHASARICTYAGQVLSYRPREAGEDLLFVSDNAYFAPGKAIKGGVPVCWPWFGNDELGQGGPAHGFVRNRQWLVSGSGEDSEGVTRLELTAPSDDETRAIWSREAELKLVVEVGARLQVSLVTRNLGDTALTITQALHSYFRVGDIGGVSVAGLDGCRYLDATDGYAEKAQQGDIWVAGEVNRIYTGVANPIRIRDAALGRTIHIEAEGSSSAVVWNPWIETARSMGDLRDDDYLRMLCVETANAGPDRITLAPGESHCLKASCRIDQDSQG